MIFDRRIAVLFGDDIEVFTGAVFKVARIDCIGPKIANGRLFIKRALVRHLQPRQKSVADARGQAACVVQSCQPTRQRVAQQHEPQRLIALSPALPALDRDAFDRAIDMMRQEINEAVPDGNAESASAVTLSMVEGK
jgi:hypothetical protein